MARPRSKTPYEYSAEQLAIIDEMALHQARDCTIAEVLGIDHETFKKDMGSRTKRQRAKGKAEALKAQYLAATTPMGTPTDRVWFGKQHLEQKDKQEVEHGVTDAFAELMKELDGSRHYPGQLPDDPA